MDENKLFADLIKDAFNAKSADLRQNYAAREILHSKFKQAWSPLIDRIKQLAKDHLPDDKELKVKLEIDDALCAQLTFRLLERDDEIALPLDTLRFRNDLVEYENLFLHCFKDSPYAEKSPELALCSLDGTKTPGLPGRHLHPDDMETAKTVLETWLATQIAFGFDQDRIYPKSSLEITLKRSGSKPENEPL